MKLDFTQEEQGFVISEGSNCLLKVTPAAGCLAVEPKHPHTPPTRELFNRCQFSDFFNACAEILYSAWLEVNVTLTFLDYENPLDREMSAAVHRLAPQIQSFWKQFWAGPGRIPNPQMAAVQAAVRSAAGEEIEPDPHLIHNPALIAAVLQHPPAAIALRHLQALSLLQQRAAYLQYLHGKKPDSDSEAENLFDWYSRAYLETPRVQGNRAARSLQDWRTLFSNEGQLYPELNQTLAQLPSSIEPKLLCHLAQWRLSRPITDRLELTAVLQFARRRPTLFGDAVLAWGTDGKPILLPADWPAAFQAAQAHLGRLIENACASELRQSMAVVSGCLGLNLDPGCSGAVAIFVNFFDGFDASGCKTLSEAAHSCAAMIRKARWSRKKGLQRSEIYRPAQVSFPGSPDIRLLATSSEAQFAADLCEVDLTDLGVHYPFFNHCFFLVNHNGSQALLIGRPGRVLIHASGHGHSATPAADWASQAFSAHGWRYAEISFRNLPGQLFGPLLSTGPGW